MDLIRFFDHEIGEYNPQSEQFIELFSNYMEVNKLTVQELQYFSIYMLSPVSYIQIVQDYMRGARKENMIKSMKRIQHAYRKIIFGLNWSYYIEKEYESLNLDDLDLDT